MSFTLGRDLGIVMAKGVVLGVIGCVTVLPALILVFDKPLQKTKHRALIPDMKGFSEKILKIFPAFLILFLVLILPSLYGYRQANNEVYYDLGECLPDDINYAVSNAKLRENYDIGSTHMVLVNSELTSKEVKKMIAEMEKVDGVKYVLGLESVIGSRIPDEVIPDDIRGVMESDKWKLLLINSEYKVASDDCNAQIGELNTILKAYDESGMLIGEGPCMKDMIETTDHDFKVVNTISIIAIFIIILLVEKSVSLPIILIALIELGIFINLGLPHYLGQSMSRYKTERIGGADKKTAVWTALYNSIPSILVSGCGLFAATFGVACYSDIEIISSMCSLMARGAIISMLLVILILPAMFMLFDKIICKTTIGMTKCV
jgi:hypothetical protein